jgi:DNA polymerase-3 subunit chi
MADAPVTEVLFYHLERQPLEKVLPTLLERTLERGWRAVVQAGGEERLAAIDLALWTHREDSFLAHGTAKDGHAARQPIFLTLDEANPNAAAVRFLVDGADLERLTGYQRIVFLFDGHDSEAIARARAAWKRAKAQNCTVTYWQQGEGGQWNKRA